MPLLDHFHPPLSVMRHGEAFHARWVSAIADALNESLPEGYFAEAQVHAGPRIEVDVATYNEDAAGGSGPVATLPRAEPSLAPPDLVWPALFPPEIAVHVFETSAGPTLVAAVELVSPSNKDREETRRVFAVKCAGYLHRGNGLIVVDVVTNRSGRPLDDLSALLDPARPVPAAGALTAVSYRPVRSPGGDVIDLRVRTLALGGTLPELPLGLDAGRVVMVNLEATYEDARERSRL